jgi:hypothetical protein
MDAETQADIKSYIDITVRFINSMQYDSAEQVYRHITDAVQEHEGKDATYLDCYNLSSVLALQRKYAEAELILRNMLNFLVKRNVGIDDGNFLEQERGTVGLLIQSIRGQGRTGEANILMADADFDGHEEQLEVRKGRYG